jgi:hypothetical protein
LRELRISVAPRAASARAIARPRPPVAPVRRAFLPSSSMTGIYPHGKVPNLDEVRNWSDL